MLESISSVLVAKRFKDVLHSIERSENSLIPRASWEFDAKMLRIALFTMA